MMTKVMPGGPEIGESCHTRCRKATKPVTVLEVDDEVTRGAIQNGQRPKELSVMSINSSPRDNNAMIDVLPAFGIMVNKPAFLLDHREEHEYSMHAE